MSSIRRSFLAAAVMLGAFSGGAIPVRELRMRPSISSKVKRGFFNDRVLPNAAALVGTRGASVSVAHMKRVAVKHRNRQRHKAASRGAR
ncbi:hypothetical protein [Herminiimonas arsenitoxidans]|uniref:hypothetical protein n=1 Tax=Herminiimonas arsenitoxidans TaxID=1809410 RepID=UPI000970F6C7|nr:hypothetical protein [Herminiimonas arsenitoxidans]